MLKSFRLIVVSTIFFSAFSSSNLSAIASEPDYPCYMIAQSGRIVDLSHSLCGSKRTYVDVAANIDNLFLVDYKQALIKKYPALQDIFLKQPSQVNIGYAHAVCNGLKSGLSLDTIQNLQAEQIVQASGSQLSERPTIIDLGLIKNLAPKYYCPQFKQSS
ncbi:MAG TPA: DUF732 domain-containing protein [Leptolyngbyaceae cyanobacterium]